MFVGALPYTSDTLCFCGTEKQSKGSAGRGGCCVLVAVRTAFQRVLFIRCHGRNFALHWVISVLLHLCPVVGNGCVCCLLHVDESYGTFCGSLSIFPYV